MKIEKLTEQQAKEILEEIVTKLDVLDCEDYFGTEGWRRFFLMEDKYEIDRIIF